MSIRYRSSLPHYPATAELSPAQTRAVAEATLGTIDWTDDVSGFCPCPGAAAHTNPTSPRDCRVSLDTVGGHAPTIHCFHASCRTAVETANHQLRSALGRATVGQSPRPHAVRTMSSIATTPPPASVQIVASADLGPDHGLPLLLRTCFAADDIVSLAPGVIAEGETRAVPEHGGVNVLTRDQWLARLETSGGINRVFGGKDGLYLRINPVVRKSTGSDKDVTRFRHTLIESDTLPKPEQERLLRASGLPIAALIDSGGNSIHAWVRVEASSAAEFHERRELLWKSVPELHLDPQNRNPSRFSRCPGGRRNEGFQRLLAVNVGPSSFAAWSTAQVECEGLIRASDFCAEDEPDPPQLIEGILFQGAKMIIAGPSKSRKTWNLTDLAIAVSLGAPWCGFPTRASTVLYVNLEIAKFSYRKRIRMICNGRGFEPASLSRFHVWNRRGKENEIVGLAAQLRAMTARTGADLLIIDPIYKTYGDREENSNTEMAQVLNELEKLAQDTGAAVLIAAHFPKGNLSGRDAIDRVAGASVFGRDPDALLIMTPHEQADAFTVTSVLRDLPSPDEFVIQWAGMGFRRIDADPKSIKGNEPETKRSPAKQARRGFFPGSYRTMFATMPPLHHDKDHAQSEILNHIAAELDANGKGDLSCLAVFDSIRQPRRKIIRFCGETKRWMGVDFQPEKEA
jgi:RecA-family ATPase